MPELSLSQFVRTLMTEGRALVTARQVPGTDAELVPTLTTLAKEAGAELAGAPPLLCEATAVWATERLFAACRLVVCRDLGEDKVVEALTVPPPLPRGPTTDWSADLLFRHLPEVIRLARHLSANDPLVRELRNLAAAWPLSSVGVANLKPSALDSFVAYPTLRRLYSDRIIAAEDASRLGDPRVDDAVRSALGAHAELCPRLAQHLLSPVSSSP
jgi:hypothetical protein